MRDPYRIDNIMAELMALWMATPDHRFCQLIWQIVANPKARHVTPMHQPLWDIEDDRVRDLIEDYKRATRR